MTKIDIFSGFLGAGKTTLIKKLIAEAYVGEKVVLIENEFGEIGIDGGFMQEAGIEVTEMNSGCICCSLVGDFGKALGEVLTKYEPDRILIEPSGVGKLSDVIRAVTDLNNENAVLNSFTTVVNAKKCKMYMKNFGEFFNNQVEYAGTIVLSHVKDMDEEKLNKCVEMLREHNKKATIITTDYNTLDGKQILAAMEGIDTLASEIAELAKAVGHDHEHHHHDEHEHHHDHDHDHCCDDNCCHDHDHEHHDHDHHHADDVFTSWGVETAKTYNMTELEEILDELGDADYFGTILRAKGIVPSEDGQWIHFDYIPGESDIRYGAPMVTGRLCVIGSDIQERALKLLFHVQ